MYCWVWSVLNTFSNPVLMHLSFVSTTPGRAGNCGGFDKDFLPGWRAFDEELNPEGRGIDLWSLWLISRLNSFPGLFKKDAPEVKFTLLRPLRHHGEPFCRRNCFVFGDKWSTWCCRNIQRWVIYNILLFLVLIWCWAMGFVFIK